MPTDLVAWPKNFGTRFLVFVDVEEEFDWAAPLRADNRATTAMRAFPDAHRRFADHGVGLVCMVDHPVAIDPTCVAILSRVIEDGRSAIGAQLHAWVTPPYAPPVYGDSYQGNLSRALEGAKLDSVTAALRSAFGMQPRVFRAGRYGLGPSTIELLAERGYLIDSSIRARYDYRDDGGPDFRRIGNAAYRAGPLVELPLTTVYTGAIRRIGGPLHRVAAAIPKAGGALARTRLLQRVPLTPENMPICEALIAVSAAIDDGERLLNLSFHSPSLAPGHTPYVRTSEELAQFWSWWEQIFAHLDALGVAPATLDETLAALGLA